MFDVNLATALTGGLRFRIFEKRLICHVAAIAFVGPARIRLRFYYQSHSYRLRSFHAVSADFV